MFRFRVLRASFPNIAYFVFEFSVLLRLLPIETICDCKRHRGKFKMF